MKVADVEFVKELYPRIREDDAAIERYRAAIEKLPPITVARGRVLVDGFHRWQAHRREGLDEIAADDLGNLADAEIIRESITRNAAHGQQLSGKDKQRLAGQLWQTLAHLDGQRVGEIAGLLSVSERTVQTWTKDARQSEKAERQARAFDLWLDCLSENEISAEIDVPQQTINGWITEKRKSADFGNPPASRQHFDVWQFQSSDDSAGSAGFFGRMPPQVVENLLWLYTEPGDIVRDPFAGSGTTIDVAKRMGRRVYASDLTPSTPTLPIHAHDAAKPWPAIPSGKAKLILLDPPYWQQAKGRYSDNPRDLGNVSIEGFNDAWAVLLGHAKSALDKDGRVAFIVSPTQLDDGHVIDHAFAMASAGRALGLTIERRIIVTYQTQQATGQQVEWARKERRLLKLYRDLVVMRP